MNPSSQGVLQLHDCAPSLDQVRAEVLRGLRRPEKELPCKLFYDQRGSWLFEQICELDEYYLTRTELAIMQRHAGEMVELVGPSCLLVEFGSGSGLKTRTLLSHLPEPAGYVPIDISRTQLIETAAALLEIYPQLPVWPVCADYTGHISLPPCERPANRTVVYFPGSTIGNFHPREAREFLLRIRNLCGQRGGLLIGVDLKKDPRLLHAAYNDATGVTAAFNLNLLRRINRELNGDFAPNRFSHYAFYNTRRGRIEMHLVSLAHQIVHIDHQRIEFQQGESIFTESSYKYTVEEFEQLAIESGFRFQQLWTDERRFFSVQYLTAR